MKRSRQLIVLHPSPWSERARWALDHHGLEYDAVDHMPIVGERRLRKLSGRQKERVTVPVLVVDGNAHCESWDIALYADREGTRDKLMPAGLEAEIRQWNQVADAGMGGVRARVFAKMLESGGALDASAPSFVPKWLRPALRPVARLTIRQLQRKYQARSDEGATHVMQLRGALDRLRDVLVTRRPDAPYILGRFTYADIAMATLVQGVLPVEDRFLRLASALREVWTERSLVREYDDLVKWRDTIYDRHRYAKPN
ncbi:glutathione S-transferase family protein [Pendulispora albinea]|uniref:Glutathione S-transferase n=1 Tax=Pendulispora albinea TaxID=2741071 RepID=A0ABZ2LZ80_9BACT